MVGLVFLQDCFVRDPVWWRCTERRWVMTAPSQGFRHRRKKLRLSRRTAGCSDVRAGYACRQPCRQLYGFVLRVGPFPAPAYLCPRLGMRIGICAGVSLVTSRALAMRRMRLVRITGEVAAMRIYNYACRCVCRHARARVHRRVHVMRAPGRRTRSFPWPWLATG